ncbi:Protein BPL-1 c, partial [Aphelenchoides avenae]
DNTSRLNRSLHNGSSAYRYRSCSPIVRSYEPATASSTGDSSQLPTYIRQLRSKSEKSEPHSPPHALLTVSTNSSSESCSREHSQHSGISPSSTLDDFLDNSVQFIDYSIQEEVDHGLSTTPRSSTDGGEYSKEQPKGIECDSCAPGPSNVIGADHNGENGEVKPSKEYQKAEAATKAVIQRSRQELARIRQDFTRTSWSLVGRDSRRSSKMASVTDVHPSNMMSPGYLLGTAAESCRRKRFSSLIPGSEFYHECMEAGNSARRRSLSPLTLSILENYGSKEALEQISYGSPAKNFLCSDSIFRRSITPSRRRFCSQPRRENNNLPATNGATDAVTPRPKPKPPTILVYTGDQQELFSKISVALQRILPPSTYTVFHLSTKALTGHPWIEDNSACLLIADTKPLNDQAWSRLQAYFVHSGKILFVCQNSLLANLTSCDSVKKQAHVLKNAFGNKSASAALGKDFEQFLKKSLKTLSKSKHINETFHAKDLVGGYRYSVVFFKKEDQPLLLYMENSEHHASALFSDATTDELLQSSGGSLISDAMTRLGIEVVDAESAQPPALTPGYLVCDKDRLVLDMKGLSYTEPVGMEPSLVFRPTAQLTEKGENLPGPSAEIVPVEVRRRKDGLPVEGFDTEKYFANLQTKTLGRALIYVPVCETTTKISKSLSKAVPGFDGVLVVAERQTSGVGRGGNQWLSPAGCALFTFNFNIPIDSELGRSIGFVQHVLAVAIVDAVCSLVDVEDFPLKIKWPNDIYYGRSYKMGGCLVSTSVGVSDMNCTISAGLNVANSKPTVCINDMLPEDTEKLLNVEEVVAAVMNKFEYYVHLFVSRGQREFLNKYYEYWLHTREEVTIVSKDSGMKEKVVIRGLDSYGYLEVRSKQSGRVFSVHDDGNTFDMMKGLIRPKG